MRAVESLLTEEPQPLHVLAAGVYGVDPTRAQIESVRRACSCLDTLGRATLTWVWLRSNAGSVRRNRYRAVRTGMTESERTEHAQLIRANRREAGLRDLPGR